MKGLAFFTFYIFLWNGMSFSQQFVSPCADADIVFLADWSGSIMGFESSLQEGLETLVSVFPPKKDAVRYGIVSFSSAAWIDVMLTDDSSQIKNVLNIWGIRTATGGTNLLDGLYVANYLFESSPRNTKKILVLVTDGDIDSDSEKGAISFSSNMKERGITILTIDVGSSSTDTKFIEEISDLYFHSSILLLSENLKNIFSCL